MITKTINYVKFNINSKSNRYSQYNIENKFKNVNKQELKHAESQNWLFIPTLKLIMDVFIFCYVSILAIPIVLIIVTIVVPIKKGLIASQKIHID